MKAKELMDLDTRYKVQKAAPQVTVVPFDLACWVVRGMAQISQARTGNVDRSGNLYWESTVKELAASITHAETVWFSHVGRALRDMGLTLWREGDGYHVAWSAAQLEILKEYFKA